MEQMSRIDARIPLSVRKIIDMAALLEGRTRTDFLIDATAEKARKVIAENKLMRLSMKDKKMLTDALASDDVRSPDEFNLTLAIMYRETVIE